jgi:hypothetical protein
MRSVGLAVPDMPSMPTQTPITSVALSSVVSREMVRVPITAV